MDKKININVDPPQPNFYYIKNNGEVFVCAEQEAATINHQLKQYGVSDGSVYYLAIMKIKENLDKAYQMIEDWERQLLETADEKEQSRLRGLINQKNNDIVVKVPKFIKEAQALDRESAKGKFRQPRKFDFFDINGSRMSDVETQQNLGQVKDIIL